jgi:phosphate transport system substrate-binding protein
MMTITRGRCANVDYCELAAAGVDIEVPLGAPFVCPECAKDLRQPPADRPLGRAADLAILCGVAAGLLCAGVGVGYALFGGGGGGPRPPAVAAAGEHAGETEAPKPATVLRLEGSALLAAGLAPKLAAAFLTSQGDTGVTVRPGSTAGEMVVSGLRAGRPENVVVTADGSDAAFAALAAGRANVAMATRRMTGPELKRLNVPGDAAAGRAVAMAVPAVIVNPANAVSALTVESLSAVLDGSISTWMPLGGSVEPIHLLQSTEQAEAAAGSGGHQLSDAVMRDEDSIAVVSLPRAGAAKVLAIGAPGVQPTAPSDTAISSMTYPLAHRLYLYAPATAPNRLAQLFVDYALSPEGQAMVPKAGLVPLPAAEATTAPPPATPAPAPQPAPPAKAEVAAAPPGPGTTAAATPAQAPQPAKQAAAPDPWTIYRGLSRSARVLASGLHFQAGTYGLDPAGERDLQHALALIAAAKPPPGHVVLAGFAAGQASPAADLAASRAGVDAVAARLAKAGTPPGQTLALGSGSPQNPVRGTRRWVEMYVLN